MDTTLFQELTRLGEGLIRLAGRILDKELKRASSDSVPRLLKGQLDARKLASPFGLAGPESVSRTPIRIGSELTVATTVGVASAADVGVTGGEPAGVGVAAGAAVGVGVACPPAQAAIRAETPSTPKARFKKARRSIRCIAPSSRCTNLTSPFDQP